MKYDRMSFSWIRQLAAVLSSMVGVALICIGASFQSTRMMALGIVVLVLVYPLAAVSWYVPRTPADEGRQDGEEAGEEDGDEG